MEITWLGHSTVVVDLDGVRIVADPLLGRNNGILRRRGEQPPTPAWEGADAVLLSHLHHDHAEVPSLKRFPGVPVLTAPDNSVWVRKKGLDGRGLADDEWFPLGPDGRVRGQAGAGDPPLQADAPPPQRRQRPPGPRAVRGGVAGG